MALRQCAEIHLETGDFENFLGAIRQIPEYQPALDFLANLADRPNVAADSQTLHLELLLALGIAYYETGELSRAQDALLSAARLDPKNYLCYYYLGLCEMARICRESPPGEQPTVQNLRPALAWFKKAVNEVNPEIVAKRTAESLRVCRRLRDIQ